MALSPFLLSLYTILFYERFYNMAGWISVSGINSIRYFTSIARSHRRSDGFQGILSDKDQPLIIADKRVLT